MASFCCKDSRSCSPGESKFEGHRGCRLRGRRRERQRQFGMATLAELRRRAAEALHMGLVKIHIQEGLLEALHRAVERALRMVVEVALHLRSTLGNLLGTCISTHKGHHAIVWSVYART